MVDELLAALFLIGVALFAALRLAEVRRKRPHLVQLPSEIRSSGGGTSGLLPTGAVTRITAMRRQASGRHRSNRTPQARSSARRRSATRSTAASMPHESRMSASGTASGEFATDAWV